MDASSRHHSDGKEIAVPCTLGGNIRKVRLLFSSLLMNATAASSEILNLWHRLSLCSQMICIVYAHSFNLQLSGRDLLLANTFICIIICMRAGVNLCKIQIVHPVRMYIITIIIYSSLQKDFCAYSCMQIETFLIYVTKMPEVVDYKNTNTLYNQ